MFLLVISIIIHEIGHLLAASLLKINASKIKFNLLGGVTEYDTILNTNIYKELFIVVMGPAFQIIFIYIIYKLRLNINPRTYENFIIINKLLLSFNLLPIINLDGGKILNLILNLKLPFLKSYNISLTISYISLIFIPYLFNIYFSILIIIFLIKEIYISYKTRDYHFNKLLLERLDNNIVFKRQTIIKDIKQFYKNRNHLFYKEKTLIDEIVYIKKLFKKY